MALNKLYYVYGLDTACFYTDEENEIEKRLLKARHLKNKLKVKLIVDKISLRLFSLSILEQITL